MNTSEIITALKIKGSFPSANDLFSDSDYLVLMNMAMKTEISPVMISLNDEYLLATKDYTISQGSTYRLPTRTISVRDIQWLDSGNNITDLVRNFEEDRPRNRSGYYITRNSIELSDDYNSGTLRVKYFARPSTLVLTTACGQIQSIDTGNDQITLVSTPATFVTGAVVDLVQNKNPYDLMSMDLSIVNVSGNTIELPSLPSGLAAGDWLCLATESPVPLAPEELHPLLVQAVLVDCLSSKKDKAWESAQMMFEEMKTSIVNMLDPRVENTSAKLRTGLIYNYFTRGRYW